MTKALLVTLAVLMAVLPGCRRTKHQAVTAYEFAGPQESEFVPLRDSDLCNQITIAQSSISPGTPGSPIPSINSFYVPTHGELARLLRRIHFATDDYTVRDAEYRGYLTELANYLKAHPNTFVFIEGHCDERGAATYNLALGSRRSNSVREFLIKHGVDHNQLFTVSYGKEKPIAMGHDSSSWKENRRAQFKVYEKA